MMFFFGASSADRALTEAEDLKLNGVQKAAYAAGVGGFEAVLMALGGAVGKKLGLETVEEALFRDVRPELSNLMTRYGTKKAMSDFTKVILGSGIEGAEESLTTLGQETWKAALGGDAEGAFDRVVSKLRDPAFHKQILESGLTGVAARNAIGAVNSIARGLERAQDQLPAALRRVADRASAAVSPVPALAGGPPVPAAESEPQVFTPSSGQPSESQPPIDPAQPTPAGDPSSAPSEAALPAAPQTSSDALAADPPPPEGPRGPAEPIPRMPPEGEPIQGISPKNEAMRQATQRLFGRDVPYGPERIAWDESVDMAIRANVPQNALSIAESVIANPRELSHVETAGLTVRAVELDQAYRKAAGTVATATQSGDLAQAKILGAQVTQIENEWMRLREALLKAGTEQGRNLAARKMQLGDDYSVLTTTGRLATAKQGPLTQDEVARIKKLVESENEASQRLKDATTQQDQQIAENFIKEAKKTESDANVESLYQRLRDMLDKGCDLA
jgi:hypothetical protein